MKIYIGGNNGVGKSTLAQLFTEYNSEFAAFSSSKVIMDTHGLSSRKEIGEVRVDNLLIAEFYSKYTNLIVDGHFYLGEYERNNFDIYIFMTAKPETILERRLSDSERIRDITMESVLKEEEKTIARAIKSGVQPIFVLYNNGNIEQTLSDLKKIISFYDFISKNKITVVSDIMKLAHRNNIFLIQDISLGMADRNFEKQEGVAI